MEQPKSVSIDSLLNKIARFTEDDNMSREMRNTLDNLAETLLKIKETNQVEALLVTDGTNETNK